MISPDAAGHGHPIARGCARFADPGGVEHAVATIEPSVRTPGERVQGFVRVRIAPAIEQYLWRPGRLGFVSIFHGNVHEIGRCAQPDAAESHLYAADQIQALHENGAAVELSNAFRVLE